MIYLLLVRLVAIYICSKTFIKFDIKKFSWNAKAKKYSI